MATVSAKAIVLLLMVVAKSAKSDNLRGRGFSSAANYFNARLAEANGVMYPEESSGPNLNLGDADTYGIQVALYDKDMKPIIGSAWSGKEPHKWTTKRERDGRAGFAGAHGYNMYDDVVKKQAEKFGWNVNSGAAGEFDYIEAQQFAFSKEDGQMAAWIKFTVSNPNDEGGKYRVDIGSKYYGTHDSSGWVEDAGKQVLVDYAGWKEYSLTAHPNDTPPPIHASIVSLNPDGTPRGNRHLMLFISFREKQATCDPHKAHCCNVKYESDGGLKTYNNGFSDADNNCHIVPPRYFCDNNVGSYKGSLMNMQDGKPINIFFEDDAELGVGITNRQWNFVLDDTDSCSTVCRALNREIGWDESAADNCQIKESIGSSMNGGPNGMGLGKLSIRGFGRISGYYLMSDPIQTLGDWTNVANKCNGADCTGPFSDSSKKVEWSIRSGLIDVTSSAIVYANDIAHDIRNVQTVWGCKRGDGNIQLSAGQGSPDNNAKDFNKKAFVYDVKQIGNWPDAADGIELYGDGSSAWHTFQQCTDDCLKLEANDVTFFATTLVSGSVGGAVNSGAYGNLWGRWPLDLHTMTADGVWIHRCVHPNGGWDGMSGIIRSGSCPKKGFTMTNVFVNDLYIPSYGENAVNYVDALFSMGSLDASSFFCNVKTEDAAGPEMYDSTFSNFQVWVNPTGESQLYAQYKDGVTIFDNINFDRIFIYKTGDCSTGWYTVCGIGGQGAANCVDSDGLSHMLQNLFYNSDMLKLSSINYPYGMDGVNEMKDPPVRCQKPFNLEGVDFNVY